jgi:hypothetical protein
MDTLNNKLRMAVHPVVVMARQHPLFKAQIYIGGSILVFL